VVYPIAKRVLDLSLALLAAIALAPMMMLIALAVRRDSPGPALFRQQRVGRRGRLILVYKFRTMTVGSPTFGPKPADHSDDRVTRIGHFLRRSSLDELPQLFNVLRGEMSLVGPRPEQPFLVEQYLDWQRERLEVLPGMTGWWQVSGRKQPMHDHVEEDLFYVQHRSMWLDMRILWRTVGTLFRGEAA
jgi:lipopolysaccharide/colanic/teichoic acid biosynthesis glycosyltransferase